MFWVKQTEDQMTIYEMPLLGWIGIPLFFFGGFGLILGSKGESGLPVLLGGLALVIGMIGLAKFPLSIIVFDLPKQTLFIRRFFLWGLKREQYPLHHVKSYRISGEDMPRLGWMYRIKMKLRGPNYLPLTLSRNTSLRKHQGLKAKIYAFLKHQTPPIDESD